MHLLISSPPYFSNIHLTNTHSTDINSKKNLTLITTPFALPFSNSIKNIHKRDEWFSYRYNFMSHHLFHNLSSQVIDQHDIGIYLWLVFVAEGDCEKFNLPKFCVLPNGIAMMWVEISIVPGCPPNDYYLNRMIPDKISSIISSIACIFPRLEYVTTLRIDSDDCVRDDYLKACSFVLSSPLLVDNLQESVFYFPCGLNFELNKSKFYPYIWPESPFMFRKELISSPHIKTVWEYPHDKMAAFRSLYPVVSTQPMWCLNVGHGNIANSGAGYHVPSDISSSTTFWRN